MSLWLSARRFCFRRKAFFYDFSDFSRENLLENRAELNKDVALRNREFPLICIWLDGYPRVSVVFIGILR
jgi:hypothetical protein